MSTTVGLIDYGSGNFSSVRNAFLRHDCSLVTITSAEQLGDCSHVVLPGVGAFSAAMMRLGEMGLVEPLRGMFAENKTPFLGICVGMQVLANRGTEFSPTAGLGAFGGSVEPFDFSLLTERPTLPHMGWNDVLDRSDSILLRDIDLEDPSFYFLHSYHLLGSDPDVRVYFAEYGYRFAACAERGKVFGVQFHPEKSQRNGSALLANFLDVPHG